MSRDSILVSWRRISALPAGYPVSLAARQPLPCVSVAAHDVAPTVLKMLGENTPAGTAASYVAAVSGSGLAVSPPRARFRSRRGEGRSPRPASAESTRPQHSTGADLLFLNCARLPSAAATDEWKGICHTRPRKSTSQRHESRDCWLDYACRGQYGQ